MALVVFDIDTPTFRHKKATTWREPPFSLAVSRAATIPGVKALESMQAWCCLLQAWQISWRCRWAPDGEKLDGKCFKVLENSWVVSVGSLGLVNHSSSRCSSTSKDASVAGRIGWAVPPSPCAWKWSWAGWDLSLVVVVGVAFCDVYGLTGRQAKLHKGWLLPLIWRTTSVASSLIGHGGTFP